MKHLRSDDMQGFIRRPLMGIIPPHMLKKIAQNGSASQKERAFKSLMVSEKIRGRREALGQFYVSAPSGAKCIRDYDTHNTQDLPGTQIPNPAKSKDIAVKEAYSGASVTYDLYKSVYDRDSIDDKGMCIDSTVHYEKDYNNAFWDGKQMVYGDGDGDLFNRFTISIDVIGHELTHGVTEYEAGLEYADQPGALNESMSDVFGSLVKQKSKKQTAEKADWLIGEGLLTKKVHGIALRSMEAPGTAYDDPVLGKDPQPATMKDYVKTSEDNGGVHYNSGIPNRAFCVTATEIGGYAWEKAGMIWYTALRDKIRPKTNFAQAANITFAVAAELYGKGSEEQLAVKKGWTTVGVKITKK
ncbi:MAG: M4 family metallopeptidase [Methanoregula sp.]